MKIFTSRALSTILLRQYPSIIVLKTIWLIPTPRACISAIKISAASICPILQNAFINAPYVRSFGSMPFSTHSSNTSDAFRTFPARQYALMTVLYNCTSPERFFLFISSRTASTLLISRAAEKPSTRIVYVPTVGSTPSSSITFSTSATRSSSFSRVYAWSSEL
uniref:Uncharacterized protein n=1 Tax=Leersia perrieri TaxID=77586 RepID=A0A0D9X2S2_9ORYZ